MRGGDTSKELAEVERRNLEIQKRLAELLYENGYPEDFLKPIYTCPICQDKGIVNDKWCQCFQKLLMGETARELNRNSPLSLSSFEGSGPHSNPGRDKSRAAGVRAGDNAAEPRVLQVLRPELHRTERRYTDASGATGWGKAHLSLAIASSCSETLYMLIHRLLAGAAPHAGAGVFRGSRTRIRCRRLPAVTS